MPRNRKRQHVHDPLQDGRLTKAHKLDHSLPNEHSTQRPHRDPAAQDNSSVNYHRAWSYPPEFWDRLSTIPLERRTCNQRSFFPPPPPPTGCVPAVIQTLTPASVRDLARFARHGGPDLRSLRGYPTPATVLKEHLSVNAMSSSSQSRATKSTDPTTLANSGTTKSRKSISAYNRGFEQHLTDHGIHTTWKSKRPELEEVKTVLVVPRPSLSPSRFSDGAFAMFQETNAQAKDEDDVLADVIPTIGTREANYPSARNTIFGHLDPLTDGTIVTPKPDIYYGTVPEQLDATVRNELGHYIVPSTAVDKPIAPNFFLEVKGPDGSAAVMMR